MLSILQLYLHTNFILHDQKKHNSCFFIPERSRLISIFDDFINKIKITPKLKDTSLLLHANRKTKKSPHKNMSFVFDW